MALLCLCACVPVCLCACVPLQLETMQSQGRLSTLDRASAVGQAISVSRSDSFVQSAEDTRTEMVLGAGVKRMRWNESGADGEYLWGTYDDACSPQ